MNTPELQSKIAAWRQRAADNTLTKDEMIEIVRILRSGRMAAAQSAAATKRKRAIAEIPSATDMLNEMDGL